MRSTVIPALDQESPDQNAKRMMLDCAASMESIIGNYSNAVQNRITGESSDDLYDLPREFVICGSCVFHRSHVIASHLCTRDLLDIRLWLKFTSVADLTREHPVRKIVLWQELHSPDHTDLE